MSVKIICCHKIFLECAGLMSLKLEIPVEVDVNPQRGDLYIVFGAHVIAPKLWQAQKAMNNEFGYIIMNSEQIGSDTLRNKYYLMLCQENPTFNYSQHLAQEMFDQFNIKEYSFFFFDFLSSPQIESEYDIVFVGTRNAGREAFERLLREVCPTARIHFEYDSINAELTHLTDLYTKSKIVLNLPFYEGGCLETHRINKAIACGAHVVSCLSGDQYANNFYTDYVHFCDGEANMIDCLKEQWQTLERKKTWLDFMKTLSVSLYSHNKAVIDEVHGKLLTKLGLAAPLPKA